MGWFKSWDGAPTDPKWLVIGRRTGALPGVVSALWWALMDHANQAADRGSVSGFDSESYAAFTGFDESQICQIIQAFQEKSLIKDGRLAAWDKRQPKDPTSAVRKRAQREREKNTTACSDCVEDVADVTHVTRDAVTVTRQTDKTRQDREEKGSVKPEEGLTGADAPLTDSRGLAGSSPEVSEPVPKREPKPEPKSKPGSPRGDDPWVAIYARGKEVLGRHAGSTITCLRKLYDDKPRKVLAKIEDAAEQREPARWLYAFLHKVDDGGKLSGMYIGGIPQ